MKNVRILSRSSFFKLVEKLKLEPDDFDEGNVFLVSINDPKGWNEEKNFLIEDRENAITLEFGDFTQEVYEPYIKSQGFKFKVVTEADILKIKKFINKIKNKNLKEFELLIHCQAGHSRSAAVGLYAYEQLLSLGFKEFKADTPTTVFNQIIYKKLRE